MTAEFQETYLMFFDYMRTCKKNYFWVYIDLEFTGMWTFPCYREGLYFNNL